MEVFAGFGEYADHEIGRLIRGHRATWASWTTRSIFYIVGDNGASAEGGMNGLFNEMTYFNGVHETVAGHPQALRRSGRPDDLPPLRRRLGRGRRHAVHVDQAGRRAATAAPATAWSSTGRKGIKAKGEVRSQWHHVIDIAPTILEAAGLPEPKSGERHAADADRRREHGLHLRRRQGEGAGTRRSTSRSSATAPSTTTAGWPAPSTGPPGRCKPRRHAPGRQVGTLRHRGRTSARRTTWPRRIPRSSRSCRTSS